MNNIIITDKSDEIIKTGKDIFKSKPDVYKGKTLEAMMHVINLNMPNATTSQKEEMLYRAIYDYWVYGVNVGEEFFYRFPTLTHEEKRSYISSRERFLYVKYLNDMQDIDIVNNKWKAYNKFKEFYRRDVILLNDENDYDTFCEFTAKHNTFVVKPMDLALSQGVYKATVTDHTDKKEFFNKLLEDGRAYKDKFIAGKSSSVLLEEIIPQSQSISILHPHSANAIRCTTIRVGDKVHIYYPWIKIGVNGAFATTASLGSLLAGVDAQTGIIYTDGIGEYGQVEEYHPNSKIKIKGFQIPRWDELCELATQLSKSLPTLRYIGWDLVLTDDGWCVMEGNYGGEFLWQLLQGRGMKKDLQELIGWKPDKEFWWK